MRSVLAVATCVAFLANASLACAADGSATAIAGFCEWSSEPQLTLLTEVVDDASCVSDESVVLDPHLAAMVHLTPVYEGEREVGKPSGVRTDVSFRWFPAPITDADDPGQVVFAMNRYESYRELKAKHDAWSTRVAAVGERAGEIVASRTFVIGPAWMKSATAAWVQTGVQVSGDLAFQAPFVVAAPFTGFTSLLPLTAMHAESLHDAPVATGHGASELVEGVRTRDFPRALEGAGEFCGGVGIVLTAAAPMMEAGSALAPRTTPITPFAGRQIPTLKPAPVAPVALPPPPPRVTVPIAKFRDYIFREQGPPHGKDVVFKRLGYTKEHSAQLARIWEEQAAAKFANGEYSLGKLNEHGQRINIEIELVGIGDAAGRTSYLESGWMLENGHIRLNTPFSGFTR